MLRSIKLGEILNLILFRGSWFVVRGSWFVVRGLGGNYETDNNRLRISSFRLRHQGRYKIGRRKRGPGSSL